MGHGIPEETLDAAHAAAAALWESPAEVRSSLDARKSELSRGYLGLGALEHTCTRAELATLAQERLGGGGEEEKEKEKEKEEEKKREESKTKPSVGGGTSSSRSRLAASGKKPTRGRALRCTAPTSGRDAEADESGSGPARLQGRGGGVQEAGARGGAGRRARPVAGAHLGSERGARKKRREETPSMFEAALSKPAALTVMLRYPPLP